MRLRLRKAASLRMGRGTLWRIDATPFGVEHHFAFLPRVVAALQPWAEGLNPFRILAVHAPTRAKPRGTPNSLALDPSAQAQSLRTTDEPETIPAIRSPRLYAHRAASRDRNNCDPRRVPQSR